MTQIIKQKRRRFVGGYEPEAIGKAQTDNFHRSSLQLDGVNEYLVSNGGVATSFGIGNTFSIAIWVNSSTSADLDGIFDFTTNQASLNEGRIMLQQTPLFSKDFAAVFDLAGVGFVAVATTSIDTSGFHQYVLVKDETTSLTIYRDGEAINTETATVPVTADWDRIMTIGVQADESTGFWNGLFHSMAMWDAALGPEEVAAIYNNGYGATVDLKFNADHGPGCTYRSAPNLVHWWRPTYDWSDPGKDYGYSDDPISLTLNNLTVADISQRDPRGGGMLLNGTNERIQNTDLNNYGVGDNFSIMYWFQVDLWNATLDGLVDLNSNGANVDRIFITTFSGNYSATVYDSDGNSTAVSGGPISGHNFTVHQIMVTKDADNLKFYVNGKLTGTQASTVTLTNVLRKGCFGSDLNGVWEMDGWGIQAATWDKALSAAEIKAIYNGGHGNVDLKKRWGDYTSYGNLQHWWWFCQSQGKPVGDFTANQGWGYDMVPSNKIPMAKDSVGMTSNANKRQFARNTSGVCVDLDGSTEYLAYAPGVDHPDYPGKLIGVADNFSISQWVLNDNVAVNDGTCFEMREATTNANVLTMSNMGSAAADPFRVEGPLKNWDWGAFLTSSNVWYHVVLTWDGTDYKLYRNAVEIAPSVKTTDNPQTYADSVRRIYLGYSLKHAGRYWNGRIGHTAIFDTVLDADQIAQIYVGQNVMDLEKDIGDYNASGNLVHWWKPGEDLDDVGEDYVTPSTGTINIGDNSANITYELDFPGDAPRHGSN